MSQLESDKLTSDASVAGTTVIIDTGCANLSSVRYAFERLLSADERKNLSVTDDIAAIKAATRVVLPGVGTAGAAMASLRNKNLVEVIKSLSQPVLGVCLGMQMLTRLSKERGATTEDCQCLGLIPTEIEELDSNGLPLPHMGWNQITPSEHPIFDGISEGDYVYFVHSYRAPIGEFTIASAEHGEQFSAAIAKDNFIGLQFHPEKSATVGARMLKNFLNMSADTCNQNNNSNQCEA
ncbi:Imidazole glycerol phosphate synthase, glutamine amidotransferase subunit [Shewanella piezotolerans WP3]|uniref:Imidazole glycerol phosphate synthase subunit HisH n=1 Tax=Shewanella piezotolerans (strain WP3 / JCM 13877) TaxID=225849 RepID=B8CR52_SHEPW|nr:imidazole glycerol phosphate synthase subunit HisH [Shewanella piezotolerans]ACJ29724.1 Imidazole glycerol phosphate synthase, glutamine amidotransferase subunit [Shewanella piezotolerans WP3]